MRQVGEVQESGEYQDHETFRKLVAWDDGAVSRVETARRIPRQTKSHPDSG